MIERHLRLARQRPLSRGPRQARARAATPRPTTTTSSSARGRSSASASRAPPRTWAAIGTRRGPWPGGRSSSEGSPPRLTVFADAAIIARSAVSEADHSHGTRPLDEGKVSPSDAELIERCLRKDNAAWELARGPFSAQGLPHRLQVHGQARRGRGPDPGDLPEGLQEPRQVQSDADFSTWLSSVARNYCIDRYRASKRESEVVVEDLVAFDLAPASFGNPHRAARGPGPEQPPAARARPAARQAARGGGAARSPGSELPGDGRSPPPARGDGEEPHQPRDGRS